MSGPGGGGLSGSGDVPGPGGFDCALVSERTILNSPDPAVLAGLKVDDVLTVTLLDRSGRRLLAAVAADGRTAGSLTLPLLPRLLECMDQGFQYVAIVVEISGGRCIVHIRPRGRPS